MHPTGFRAKCTEAVRRARADHKKLKFASPLDRSDRPPEFANVEWEVVVFDEETADGLVSRLRPDVHAKGTDYTERTVPERGSVRAAGGSVAIAGDPKDHSTRDFISRILVRFGKQNGR